MKKRVMLFIVAILMVTTLQTNHVFAKRVTKQEEALQIALKFDGALYYELQHVYKERKEIQAEIKRLIKSNPDAKNIFINKRVEFEKKYGNQLAQLDKDVKEGKITAGKAQETKRQLWISYIDKSQHFQKLQILYKNVKAASNLGDSETVKIYLGQLLQVERAINQQLKEKINEVKR
ncbi:MAG: hypothetical protein ACI35O_08590 [Bacillaceae bacterium]